MEKLFTTRFGSNLYGTQTPTSDIDLKHIVLPSLDDLLLGKAVKNVVKKTNKEMFRKNSAEDVDAEFVPLQVFALDFFNGQTYALELAFSVDGTEAHQEIYNASIVTFCHALRENFLTSNVTALVDYAVNQASLYSDKGERLNALNAAKKLFSAYPKDFTVNDVCGDYVDAGFDIEAVKIAETFPKYFNITKYEINSEGDLRPCIKLLEKTLPFHNTFEVNLKTINAQLKRYGSRAKEASYENIDWKAVAHSMRIVDEGITLLTTHKLAFPFDAVYANYLLNIKHGHSDRETVFAELNSKLETLKQLEKESTLPKSTPELKQNLENFTLGWLKFFYKL